MLRINQNGNWGEFWAAGKQFFRRNSGGFQRKIVLSSGQKDRRLGTLTFFKQALGNGMKWCQIINSCLASQDQAPACVARVEGLGGGCLFRVRFHQQRISSAKR